ncbi:unnamed protein product [Rotaria sordida]|uniref:VWFA domain-containing protein n=1 Tax=Rotaria sordida TaxID=392033 RepID=A0A814HE88_9BILA|nr:unnamed protein product [Rotaria sordida]CAF1008300.1 unnamed protein product [Rotaria sordida]CAF1045527.1 unnamed protein product [Rotaria sordida]CAF1480074.1 unnamed protein product [Rotaria sordida]CAF3564770.1 unnamed protein product [Rotaria sordida]
MDYSIYQNEFRLKKFEDIIHKYNINYDFAFRLRALEGFEIVMIIDDSSSMRTPIINYDHEYISSFNQLPTRWDELKHIVSIIVDLAATLDPDGIDIYFLNRQPLLHVIDSSQLHETFSHLPTGPTPMTHVLNYVLNLKRSHVNDRKLLILIATDGLPTDDNGQNDLNSLEKVLLYERYPSIDRMYVTFIACTNDVQIMASLNNFDKNIPYVDVLDDYQSERIEILNVQGKHFPFSYGDYVVKILLGSIDSWFDYLDEKKVKLTFLGRNKQQNSSTRKTSCTIS